MYKLSTRSLGNLQGVHPKLVQLIQLAIQITPVDFGVSCGVRTPAEQHRLYSEGSSTTLNSMHLPQHDGYSHAVDLFVIADGKVTWEHKHFRKVIQTMFTAAITLGLQIEAGALWRDFLDSPHIELNRKYYGSP